MPPLPYIVAYAVRGDAAYVVRILHGAQLAVIGMPGPGVMLRVTRLGH